MFFPGLLVVLRWEGKYSCSAMPGSRGSDYILISKLIFHVSLNLEFLGFSFYTCKINFIGDSQCPFQRLSFFRILISSRSMNMSLAAKCHTDTIVFSRLYTRILDLVTSFCHLMLWAFIFLATQNKCLLFGHQFSIHPQLQERVYDLDPSQSVHSILLPRG